jgi:AbrB family looped-hinge helix DNA binding protein
MIAHATITSKGQLTVPIEIRKKLGLSTGRKVMFVVKGGEVVLQAVAPVESLFGAVKADKYVEFHKARDEAHRNRVKERIERNAGR